ncbi:Unknown protein sequence [Pseudomonas amygdali pv. lachrymans]|uniref:Uncharacterized protein n=1 Tax=Pseudomonas amygdali pv. lachrymans TaxID=53707 RepID=A0ABR5KMV2_PSEAV|nr:Unknown protein sequence [Pseudomonas amygdali pv. lachrymans]
MADFCLSPPTLMGRKLGIRASRALAALMLGGLNINTRHR